MRIDDVGCVDVVHTAGVTNAVGLVHLTAYIARRIQKRIVDSTCMSQQQWVQSSSPPGAAPGSRISAALGRRGRAHRQPGTASECQQRQRMPAAPAMPAGAKQRRQSVRQRASALCRPHGSLQLSGRLQAYNRVEGCKPTTVWKVASLHLCGRVQA
eukprot:349806-Chlamydomonas_euryale.AAC.2